MGRLLTAVILTVFLGAAPVIAQAPLATAAPLAGQSGQDNAKVQKRPSWCHGSLNAAENTICDTQRLWALDDQLNTEFRFVLSDGDDKEGARASQRAWLLARNGCEIDVKCLEAVYRSRIAFLSTMH